MVKTKTIMIPKKKKLMLLLFRRSQRRRLNLASANVSHQDSEQQHGSNDQNLKDVRRQQGSISSRSLSQSSEQALVRIMNLNHGNVVTKLVSGIVRHL